MQLGSRIGSRIELPHSAMRMRAKPRQTNRRVVASLRTIVSDVLLVWDAFSILACGIIAASAYYTVFGTAVPGPAEAGHYGDDLIRTSVIGALLAPAVIRERHLRCADPAAFRTLIQRNFAVVALALIVAFATKSLASVPSLWVALWLASAAATTLAGRMLAAATLCWSARRFGSERVVIVGAGAEADWLRAAFQRSASAGLELVDPASPAHDLDATIADLVERGRRGELDRVVLALPGLAVGEVRRIAYGLKALRVEVASVLPLLGAGALPHTTELAGIPLFLVTRRPQWGYGGLTKQVMDRCLALALLVWTTPLLLLIALAVRLDSPGPVLFRQRRHGVNGSEFEILKFRTMAWQGQSAASGAVQTGRRDPRITRVGAFLRASSLDEVPQLLNVLNGTMSLVGPRPHPTVMRTEERLGDEITPDYPHRHRVKPGITGWAQINGLRGATETAEQLRQRIEHDNFYIENWSPWFDLRILARTPASLLFRRHNAF